MRNIRSCIALLLLLTPSLGAAQVYRWVDQNGRVQYSQTPPPSGEYQPVTPAAPPPGDSPNVDALRQYSEQADKNRLLEQQQAQRTGEEQARRQQRCSQARQRAAYYGSVNRVFSIDDKGERTYLDSQQIDQRRADAQAAVETACQ